MNIKKSNSIKYQIQPEKISWNLKVSNNLNSKIRESFTNKIYIRLIHALFFLIPGCKSFKVGGVKNLPKFIVGRQLPYDYKIEDIINQSINENVVIGGWGLRHWELVKKNKISIVRDFKNGLKRFNFFYKQYDLGRFLFVHIRRTDFLTVNKLSAINFSDEIWFNAITKIAKKYSLKRVVIFSDEEISVNLKNALSSKNIFLINPKISSSESFLKLFINGIAKADVVLCNASTLSLSCAFIYHEEVAIPSEKNGFKIINLDKAQITHPTNLNWK